MKVSGVLIASGASRRLGKPKQLLPWQGSVLINKIIDNIRKSAIEELIIVLGYKHKEISNVLDKSNQIMINENWELGKSESIKMGLHEIALRSDAVVFFTSDQPFLSAELFDQIIIKASITGADIVTTRSGDITSIPTLFKNSTFKSLLDLQDEDGGKKVINMQKYETDFVYWDDQRILIDIDTECDYQTVLKADRT